MGIKKDLLDIFYDIPAPLIEIGTLLLGFLLIFSAMFEGWNDNNQRDEDDCSCKKSERDFYSASLALIIILWVLAVLYTYGIDYCLLRYVRQYI